MIVLCRLHKNGIFGQENGQDNNYLSKHEEKIKRSKYIFVCVYRSLIRQGNQLRGEWNMVWSNRFFKKEHQI